MKPTSEYFSETINNVFCLL